VLHYVGLLIVSPFDENELSWMPLANGSEAIRARSATKYASDQTDASVKHNVDRRRERGNDVGSQARIHERDTPVIDIAVQQFKVLATPGKHEVVRGTLIAVAEVAFDHIGFVTQTEDEILVPIRRIILHYMP